MYKKLIIITLCLIMTSPFTLAKSNTKEALERIENNLFGIEYVNESTEKRLERIEENVYGKVNTGKTKDRIAKLEEDLNTNLKDIDNESQIADGRFNQDAIMEEIQQEDSSVDYPVIDEMEKKLFNKKFKNKDIKERLSKLEQEIFHSNYAQDDLNTRTERLKAMISPEQEYPSYQQSNNDLFYNPNNPQNYYSRYNNADSFDTDNVLGFNPPAQNYFDNDMAITPKEKDNFQSSSIEKTIKKMERQVFQENYPSESVENRLARLENGVFCTNFNNDDAQTRITRLKSVLNAQPSTQKYDSYKFQQHLSTFMQVGTIILMVLAMIL